jgi:hypothetical protein
MPALSDRNTILAESLDTAVAAAGQRARKMSVEAAFRARVDERLGHLETDLTDLKSRLNGLYAVIGSTVLAQVLLRVAI